MWSALLSDVKMWNENFEYRMNLLNRSFIWLIKSWYSINTIFLIFGGAVTSNYNLYNKLRVFFDKVSNLVLYRSYWCCQMKTKPTYCVCVIEYAPICAKKKCILQTAGPHWFDRKLRHNHIITLQGTSFTLWFGAITLYDVLLCMCIEFNTSSCYGLCKYVRCGTHVVQSNSILYLKLEVFSKYDTWRARKLFWIFYFWGSL